MPPWSFCGSTIALTSAGAVDASTGVGLARNVGQGAGSHRSARPARRGALYQVPTPTLLLTSVNAYLDGVGWTGRGNAGCAGVATLAREPRG